MYGRGCLVEESSNYYSGERSVAKECWEKPVASFKFLNKFQIFVFLLLFMLEFMGRNLSSLIHF
jgi:hypothetical protein